jgi:DNA-binding HxlR family transcriptional regulator
MKTKWTILLLFASLIVGLGVTTNSEPAAPNSSSNVIQQETTAAKYGGAHIFILVAIMAVAGALGGSINHFLTRDDAKESYLGRCLLVGVGASFLVPLFLRMVSSNLVDPKTDLPSTNYLVFFGFCLLAAISSKAFIQTLSDRLLKLAEDAKVEAQTANKKADETQKDVKDLEATAEAVITKETEPDDEGQLINFAMPSDIPAHESPPQATSGDLLNERTKRVLGALVSGRFTMRSLSGLARDSSISREELQQRLNELIALGYVDQTTSRKTGGLRWYATGLGRKAAELSERNPTDG